MNCQQCGELLPNKSMTCPSCEQIAERPKSKMRRKKRWLIFGISLSILLAALLLIWFWLFKPIKLEIEPVGDSFDGNCMPITDELGGSTKLPIVELLGSSQWDVSKTFITGAWTKSASGECVFSGYFLATPGYLAANISIDFQPEKKMILRSIAVADGAYFNGTFGVTKDLRGTIEITTDINTFNQAECVLALSLGTGKCGFIEVVNAQTGQCQGTGPYADISQSGAIRLQDSGGEQLGLGKIESGFFVKESFKFLNSSNALFTCTVTFRFEDVPVQSGPYELLLGRRGSRTYTLEELNSQDWNLHLSIGG